jgi:Zn-dependent peptidase ImmA (M78 family)/transcriptional regulator with XRE-family HTH domain
MRLGTPQFIGERLREAREARGMTQITLGELLGVSNRAISQYEKGVVSPHPEVMKNIPDKLNLPAQFFFTPLPPEEQETTLFWRSQASTTVAARVRSKWKYQWLKEKITGYLNRFVEFPSVNFPDLQCPKDPFKIQEQDIEIVASSLRKFWGLGDGIISNTIYLLENNGAIVTKMHIGVETIDAFSNWRLLEDRPYIILGLDKGSASRSRLDVAHELGHMVLHRNIDKDDFKKPHIFKLVEEQAFKFAGAFLMPSYSFASDFSGPSLSALQSLKLRWKVAMSAMLIRARDLRLISEDQENNLWRSYGRKGYRRREPLDDEIPQEDPAILQQTFRMLIENNIQTKEQICSSIPLSQTDIEELVCLPKEFLSNKPKATIINLNSKRNALIGIQ